MRFTLPLSLLLLSASAGVRAVPQPLEILGLDGHGVTLVHIPEFVSSGWQSVKDRFADTRDVCPDLKVSCVKKNSDGADETVGDIGKKEFCWNRDDSFLSSASSSLSSSAKNGWDTAQDEWDGLYLQDDAGAEAQRTYRSASRKAHRAARGGMARAKGIGCSMCSPEKNSAECNAKFAAKCKLQCQAQGPLGGH